MHGKFLPFDSTDCTSGRLRRVHHLRENQCCHYDIFNSFKIGEPESRGRVDAMNNKDCVVHYYSDKHCRAAESGTTPPLQNDTQCHPSNFTTGTGSHGARSVKLVCKPKHSAKPATSYSKMTITTNVAIVPVPPVTQVVTTLMTTVVSTSNKVITSCLTKTLTASVVPTSTSTIMSTVKPSTVKPSTSSVTATLKKTTTIIASPTATVDGTTTVWVAPTSSKTAKVRTYVVTDANAAAGGMQSEPSEPAKVEARQASESTNIEARQASESTDVEARQAKATDL